MYEEQKQCKKLKKEIIAKDEELRNTRDEVKNVEKKNQQLGSYIEESNRNIDTLRDYIDKQDHDRKEMEIYCSKMADEVRNINSQLEDMKKHSDNLETAVQQKKAESNKLKEALISETHKLEEVAHEYQLASQDLEKYKREHKIMSDTINYHLENILLSLPSTEFRKFKLSSSKIEGIDSLCSELGKSIEEFKSHTNRTTQELKEKQVIQVKGLEDVIKKKKQKDGLVEFKLRAEVSNLRRELDTVKLQANQNLSAWKQTLQGFSDQVLQKVHETSVLKENENYKRQRQYERDIQELSSQLMKKDNDVNSKVFALQEELNIVSQRHSVDLTEKSALARKMEDLRRIVRIIEENFAMPSDIINGIWSTQPEIFEKSVFHLSQNLITFKKNFEIQKNQIDDLSQDIQNLQAQNEVTEEAKRKLEKAAAKLQIEHDKLLSICNEKYAEVVGSLEDIKVEVETLEAKYYKDVKESTIKAKESYENQMKHLTEKLTDNIERASQLIVVSSDASTVYQETKKKLDDIRKEKERLQNSLVETQFDKEKEKQENMTLKRELESYDQKLRELEMEKDKYKRKNQSLEKKNKKLELVVEAVKQSYDIGDQPINNN